MSSEEIPGDLLDKSEDLIVILPDWFDQVGVIASEVDAETDREPDAGDDRAAGAGGGEGRSTGETTDIPAEGSPRKATGVLLRLAAVALPIVGVAVMTTAVAVALRQGFLADHYPSPGRLSAAHTEVSGILDTEECTSCHHPAGMESGCLQCHEEIATQLSGQTGFHHYLLDGADRDCARCHREHRGREHELVEALSWKGQDRENFRHPHVEFALGGKHDDLECAQCHEEKLVRKFALPGFPSQPREHTHLGLSQECRTCHESPHRTSFERTCQECHEGESAQWVSGQEALSAALHALTGFLLDPPHDVVQCVRCHAPELPYQESHPDPSLPGYLRAMDTCQGCHEDEHGGQFSETYAGCLDCHDRTAFSPHGFSAERHVAVFPLIGVHAEVECEGCHVEDEATDVRIFAGTAQECRGCHDNPHGGQFEKESTSCADCHTPWLFTPATFGLDRHARVFALTAPHSAVPCVSCHRVEAATSVRVFAGTGRKCKGCHQSPHGGQFFRELSTGDCNACHFETVTTFAIEDFDHGASTAYPLLGAHAQGRCNDCHVEVDVTDTGSAPGRVRRYRETPSECSSCHADYHRGQFQKGLNTSCGDCHLSTTAWKETDFDHDTQSRFPLEGKHKEVPCEDCHPRVHLEDGRELVQFEPLGAECNDCHEATPGELRKSAFGTESR